MVEEFNLQESKAPFNMAISTLERLSGTLIKIREVSCDPLIPLDLQQQMRVKLTRQFFIQASPLLSEKVVEEYMERFKEIKANSRYILKSNSSGFKKTNEMKVIYSEELDEKIDLFLLDIQRELQKEKYFMPPKKDMGSTVGRF